MPCCERDGDGLRILYCAQLSPNDSAEYRRWALLRAGHEVRAIDSDSYGASLPLLRKLEFRACAGPEVNRLNRDILQEAERFGAEIVWCDKLLWMQPSTLQALRSRGIFTVSYMIDNFFGPRRDPGWRLYARCIALYDLHCTQRDSNVQSYRAAGAGNVLKIQTAFEPSIHFPPDAPCTDAERDRGLSFIGTPYDDRASTLLRLHADGLPVVVSGGPRHWRRALAPAAFDTLFREGEIYGRQYREAIWRSRINLAFLTHGNQDEFVHKSFEIAACGGFLLAERSAGHLQRFREDEEAVFFEGYDELRRKAEMYLDNEEARQRIALAGQRRAWTSGYDNDTQVARILQQVHALQTHDRECFA